ncbi:hypothetical protein XFF6990_310041 [Xanthomonas citri pv. fuscans]|nr:hypothetical protein XFF6990_310041 [Xanthomonas citri pv. fuscans]
MNGNCWSSLAVYLHLWCSERISPPYRSQRPSTRGPDYIGSTPAWHELRPTPYQRQGSGRQAAAMVRSRSSAGTDNAGETACARLAAAHMGVGRGAGIERTGDGRGG